MREAAVGELCQGTPVSTDAVPAQSGAAGELTRVVTCDLAFDVTEAAEIAVQVVAADSAGLVRSERFEVVSNGGPPASLEEIRNPQGERIHVILADPGPFPSPIAPTSQARPPRGASTGTASSAPPSLRL